MNKFADRYLNGQKHLPIDDKYERAYDGLVALLTMIEAQCPTGEAYLRLKLNQGGIQGVKIMIEGDPIKQK